MCYCEEMNNSNTYLLLLKLSFKRTMSSTNVYRYIERREEMDIYENKISLFRRRDEKIVTHFTEDLYSSQTGRGDIRNGRSRTVDLIVKRREFRESRRVTGTISSLAIIKLLSRTTATANTCRAAATPGRRSSTLTREQTHARTHEPTDARVYQRPRAPTDYVHTRPFLPAYTSACVASSE